MGLVVLVRSTIHSQKCDVLNGSSLIYIYCVGFQRMLICFFRIYRAELAFPSPES